MYSEVLEIITISIVQRNNAERTQDDQFEIVNEIYVMANPQNEDFQNASMYETVI